MARTVVNAVLVRDGAVLLARHSAHRAAYPGLWSFPGGHVEPGETLEAALAREAGEEIGVVPTAFRPVGTIADPNAPRSAAAAGRRGVRHDARLQRHSFPEAGTSHRLADMPALRGQVRERVWLVARPADVPGRTMARARQSQGGGSSGSTGPMSRTVTDEGARVGVASGQKCSAPEESVACPQAP